MAHRCWNESYASGELPWDTGASEPLLVEFVESGSVAPGRTLQIGAGAGTNAIWLAERGFNVLGFDISPDPGATIQTPRVSRRQSATAKSFALLRPNGAPFPCGEHSIHVRS
jgi:methyl halide transferase